jgi:predicted DNA-binding protein YlxM (UPF0122 family)
MNADRTADQYVDQYVETAWLLDVYGELLTPHQTAMIRMHFDEDLSLTEIAQKLGTTRQAVLSGIQRGGRHMRRLETVLGVAARERQVDEIWTALRQCEALLETGGEQGAASALARIRALLPEPPNE